MKRDFSYLIAKFIKITVRQIATKQKDAKWRLIILKFALFLVYSLQNASRFALGYSTR